MVQLIWKRLKANRMGSACQIKLYTNARSVIWAINVERVTLSRKIDPKRNITLLTELNRFSRCARTKLIPTINDVIIVKRQILSSALTIRIGMKPVTHSSSFNSMKRRGVKIKRTAERIKRHQSMPQVCSFFLMSLPSIN